MPNIISDQANEKYSHNSYHKTPTKAAKIEDRPYEVLVKMWSNGKYNTPLVGMLSGNHSGKQFGG